MDSVSLSPTAALKLVDVYQLAHDIKQLQQKPTLQQWQDFLMCGHIIEQKIETIFLAPSIDKFIVEVQDLLVIIDKILSSKPLKYQDLTYPITEKLIELKNILTQIQDQSKTENVQNNF